MSSTFTTYDGVRIAYQEVGVGNRYCPWFVPEEDVAGWRSDLVCLDVVVY